MVWFGTGIAGRYAERNVRSLGLWVSWRGYVSDSHSREQVGSVVPRAAVRQGIQLLRLRALWPVAGA